MMELILFAPLVGAYALYRWSEADDAKRYTKHRKSGIKAWQTRQSKGHYIKVTDTLNNTNQTLWIN